MRIRARAMGATLLVAGLMLSVACSSGSKSDGNAAGSAGDGGGGKGGGGKGGSPSHAGSAGKAGHSGGGVPGGSAGAEDTAGAAGTLSESGAGGEAGTGNACAACPSGFCLPTGECVACLANNDHCPDGQYCTDANTCAPGCKDGSGCASGVCSTAHDCQSCVSDQECSAPHVCGNNQCAAACAADQEGTATGCSTGLTCCTTHCVDATTDAAHCGACGTACSTGQFCGIGGCHDSNLAGICAIAKVALVLDGQDGNATPGRAIATALHASCSPAPAVREISQDVADAVNATNGRPVAGGDELLLAPGGAFFARLTNYVSTTPVAPVYAAGSADGLSTEYRKQGTNALIATQLNDGPHDASDYLLIQMMREPTSGSVILNPQGFWQSGTTAAAYYVVNVMLPTLSTWTKSWYVYKWTDGNANNTPDNANEFTLVDSGS